MKSKKILKNRSSSKLIKYFKLYQKIKESFKISSNENNNIVSLKEFIIIGKNTN